MTEIHIFEQDGQPSVEVLIEGETVWLSLKQISDLFERDKSVISRHLKKIFDEGELDPPSTIAKYATVQTEGRKKVTRDIEYYNLDVIISVGYRVNSKRGIQFRQWANKVLKGYLLKGYALSQRRLLSQGMTELENSIALLSRTLTQQVKLSDISQEAIRIIQDYARSWKLLLQYDEQSFTLPQTKTIKRKSLDYEFSVSCILELKQQLLSQKEATELFGLERREGLKAILGNLDQTYASEPLYQSLEEVAAHLLYFIIKDHPFIDGNKRIGSFMLLLYLRLNGLETVKINEVTLVALALLVAESSPSEKDLVILLIVNLLT